MSVDESNIVKKIKLGTVDTDENTFNDETKNIGAEAENIIVSYNNHNEIITDLAHNTVDHNEPLAITLRDMKSTFQAGVDTIVEGETSRGLTPAGSTPQALSDAVGLGLANLCDYAYDKLPPEEVAPPSVTDATISDVKTAIDAIQDVTMTSELYLTGIGTGDESMLATTFNTQNVISIKCKECSTTTEHNGIEVQTLAEVDSSTPIRSITLAVNQELTFTSEEKYVYIKAYGYHDAARATIDVKMQAKILR